MQDLRQFRNQQAYHQAFWTLLERKSYEKITISDFPEVCGLNRKTFYSYYKDVDELAGECIRELINRILSVNVQDYTNWDATYLMFEKIIRYQKEVRLIVERGLDKLVHEEMSRKSHSLEDRVMTEGMEYDGELLHEYSVAISWRCMVWGMRHADWTPEELTRTCLNTYRGYITMMANQYKSGGIR